MLKIKQILGLNVEASSRCNAKCPFCSRNQKIRPYGNYSLSLSDFKSLPESFIQQLKWVNFAGNFGDLAMNREMPAIAAYLKRLNKTIILGGDTNGSVQGENWWRRLGSFFKDGSMTFSLDGLSDTHAIHRVGTDYQKIIGNVKAFTDGGGTAHWKFILFRHNEHQIEAAQQKAGEIGCKRFFVVFSRDYDDTLKPPKSMEVHIKRDIFRSCDEKSASLAIVTCKPFDNHSLYIAADGTVHPCCSAHCMYITEHNALFDFVPGLAEKYYDRINIKTNELEDILQGPYFEEILEKSKANAFCRMKCNQFRKAIKKELILMDHSFK